MYTKLHVPLGLNAQVFPDGGAFAASDAAADQRALEPAVAWADALSDRSAHASAHATGAPLLASPDPCSLPRRSFVTLIACSPLCRRRLRHRRAHLSTRPSVQHRERRRLRRRTRRLSRAARRPSRRPPPRRHSPCAPLVSCWEHAHGFVLSGLCADGFNSDGGTPVRLLRDSRAAPRVRDIPQRHSRVALCRAADGASYARPDARPDRISDALTDGPADGPAVRKAQKNIANTGQRDCRRARVPLRSRHVN
jgi:hypothetical protein